MKKVLYGTTALVAVGAMAAVPAAAEEGVTLGLGGYYNTYFGIGGHDEASSDPRDLGFAGLFADGEVHFKGKTTLDNGITFGVQIELEAFQSGDQIDENYAFVEGSFGRFVIGGENSAAYMMQFAAPNVGVPLNSGWITSFVGIPPGQTTGFRTVALSTYVDIGNDNHGITYYSPRFSGFQIAGSWVPTPDPGGSRNGNGEGRNSPVFAFEESEMNNLLSIGANFVETFGDFDVAVSGGYRIAWMPDSPNPGEDDDEVQQISAGLVLGYAGFSVGGSYANEDSSRLIGGQSVDGWSYDVGASYSTGPWAVGVTWFQSEVEGSSTTLVGPVTFGSGDDELTALEVGISYAVGPGITASLSGLWGEFEEEDGDDSSSIVGIVGMKIGF
jgi:predicted porin